MRKIEKLFPIKMENGVLRILTSNDIDWYIDTIRQPFFNQYMEFDASKCSTTTLSAKLLSLIACYKLGNIAKHEIRAVIELEEGLAGGVTVFSTSTRGVYEIGYWIIPKYQGRGIAHDALMSITNKIEFNMKGLKALELVIREDNIRSMKVAQGAGYKHYKTVWGKDKNRKNLIYVYHPLNFNL